MTPITKSGNEPKLVEDVDSETGVMRVISEATVSLDSHSSMKDVTPSKELKFHGMEVDIHLERNTFFNGAKFSDVVIRTPEKDFIGDKIVLAAQSPVFLAFFQSPDTLATHIVYIEGFSAVVVRGFLQYIYNRPLTSLEDNAIELYRIAVKYQVIGLQRTCEKVLGKNMNLTKASAILTLNHVFNGSKLKAKANAFVRQLFAQFEATY